VSINNTQPPMLPAKASPEAPINCMKIREDITDTTRE